MGQARHGGVRRASPLVARGGLALCADGGVAGHEPGRRCDAAEPVQVSALLGCLRLVVEHRSQTRERWPSGREGPAPCLGPRAALHRQLRLRGLGRPGLGALERGAAAAARIGLGPTRHLSVGTLARVRRGRGGHGHHNHIQRPPTAAAAAEKPSRCAGDEGAATLVQVVSCATIPSINIRFVWAQWGGVPAAAIATAGPGSASAAQQHAKP
mmetsp:Transcript_4681/g.17645  ORF Transcript_4681/g.17645 Transcript_4681/m.17645 type:complete len:212 (-) Transcript_4681:1640-2275(-)